ncbi:MAG: hypothetical protein K0R13_1476 [Propionibacteriaceae bacterium]|nr:hypothetical protein [Propionibacteriaceae bacterium]
MAKKPTTAIRIGLWALPLYGALTAWATLESPDPSTDPEGWARFVSTDSYLVSHLIGSTGGTILAILGTIALGAYLAGGRSARLGVAAMVIAVAGHAVLLVPATISTFATPAIGRAYLAGFTDVMQITFPEAANAMFLLGLLLALVGNILLGVAMWRSGLLPVWVGVVWAISALVFYVLGVVLGLITTGASLPTQPVGALLIVVSGAWTAWVAQHPRPDPSPSMGGSADRDGSVPYAAP